MINPIVQLVGVASAKKVASGFFMYAFARTLLNKIIRKLHMHLFNAEAGSFNLLYEKYMSC